MHIQFSIIYDAQFLGMFFVVTATTLFHRHKYWCMNCLAKVPDKPVCRGG